MRTTVTLDPDLAVKRKAVASECGISFEQALNSALRAGLGGAGQSRRAFKQCSQPMRPRPGFNLDKALRIAVALEDEEIARKLDRRK